MEKVVFKNSKGLNLTGLHHKGSGERVVIMAHGYCGDKEFSGKFSTAAGRFCSAGYGVLRFDFAGCGESDNAHLSIAGQRDDLQSALTYCRELGYTRFALLGYSMGGLIALQSFEPAIETIILWAPVTNKVSYSWESRFSPQQFEDFAREGHTMVSTSTPFRQEVSVAKEIMAERDSIDQATLLSRVECPVLIIHGDRDERVPYSDSVKAAELLGRWGRLKTIEGGFHGLSRQIDRVIQLTLEQLVICFSA